MNGGQKGVGGANQDMASKGLLRSKQGLISGFAMKGVGFIIHPVSQSLWTVTSLDIQRDAQLRLVDLPSRKYTPGKGDKGDLGLRPF